MHFLFCNFACSKLFGTSKIQKKSHLRPHRCCDTSHACSNAAMPHTVISYGHHAIWRQDRGGLYLTVIHPCGPPTYAVWGNSLG